MKRYFIIRVNGFDWAVTDDGEKVIEAVKYLKTACEEGKTEYNLLTTIYNFTLEV